jgi:oligoribonuclease (3'-5' exoribonuclease)
MPAVIFLDLETTALLNPFTNAPPPRSHILELGMLAVDCQTLRELGAYETCLKVPSGFMGDLHPDVLEMHTNSGLLEAVRDQRSYLKREAGGWPELWECEAEALAFIHAHGAFGGPIGGFGPTFDLAWLRRDMPGLMAAFNHRCFDCNWPWQLQEWICGRVGGKKQVAHRALADCRSAVQTVRTFLGG